MRYELELVLKAELNLSQQDRHVHSDRACQMAQVATV
jgi:hypothetical protein